MNKDKTELEQKITLPETWCLCKPKIEHSMVLCIAILPSGNETVAWFSFDELQRLLTPPRSLRAKEKK